MVVDEGPHHKRRVFVRLTLRGTRPEHAVAGEISEGTLRAILESAKGVRPGDTSERAQLARKVSGYQDFDGLGFVARLGVQPPKDGYPAKNIIQEVITPERQVWKQPAQLDATAKANGGAPAAPAATSTPPAGAIERPQWGR